MGELLGTEFKTRANVSDRGFSREVHHWRRPLTPELQKRFARHGGRQQP